MNGPGPQKTGANWPRPVPLVGDTTSAAQRARQPEAWGFPEDEKEAFYRVIEARRDVRRFRPDPIPQALLERVLGAAHAAPSVGHSQPWRFIVVSEAASREQAALVAERERLRQARLLTEEAGRKLMDIQLEGIREAPLGLVVCCDRRAPAKGVLGRATFPDTDLWSCACAIENLWLAARAEGLGLGWVTLFPPEELRALVGLPDGVETLGWLCLGWPDERLPLPGLERAGWSRRVDLATVVLSERWPGAGPPPPPSALRSPGQAAVVGARDRADQLLTAPGSLGALDKALDRLGSLGLSTIAGGTLVVVAADHPVWHHGVSTYPQATTREVLEATVAGESFGAATARAAGLAVKAVDAGVQGGPVPGTAECRPPGRRGDLANEDALELTDVAALLEAGRRLGAASPARLLALGEVGMANTTVAAAVTAALLHLTAEETVGLGASGDSATLRRKREVVAAALRRAGELPGPMEVLAALGGPELAVLAGVVLGAAGRGAGVVLDGLATSVAALCAVRLEPGAAGGLIAGQRSREKAHPAVLDALGLEPLLDLRLRAGEGIGATLSCQLLATGLRARSLAGKVGP
ncbi:MAG: 5,6-dimethylbenzimidazole synthase [Actinomycetota bacterium]|nr:5,6-dimethylbenzimidazole synthase [Actinomycetota bacterium]